MKKLICPLLILSLTLLLLTASYAQDTNLDTLRASDVNGDGMVNILDLTLIASSLGAIPTEDQSPNPDVNGDGSVNILDLTLVAGHLGKTVRPPVTFVSANPVMDSQLDVNGTITLTFDDTPEDLTVSTGTATITGETVVITGPFDPGALALTIGWGDGTQTLNYTIRPPAAFVSADPVIDSQLDVNGTITLTFDNTPEDVAASTGIATVIDKIVTIAGPFEPGALVLTVTWTDGVQTLNYTIKPPVVFVSASPASGAEIAANATITVIFDKSPGNVTVNTGVATTFDKAVTIKGPFDPGPLALTITWADGSQTLTYTIRPPVAFVRANPVAGARLAVNDTITLTFDNTPEDVTVSTGTASINGKKVKITGPFDPGALVLTITWADGSQTLTYTTAIPDTEAPKITGGTVSDGDKGVDPEAINSSTRIEVEFSEEVTGNIRLQTVGGNDAGWLGTIKGNTGTLELVKGKELGNEITYVIAGKVSDAAGNETDLDITFATVSKTSGIPFEVTDATFNTLVLGSEIPVVVEFKTDW